MQTVMKRTGSLLLLWAVSSLLSGCLGAEPGPEPEPEPEPFLGSGVPEGADPSYGSSEAALEASGQPALDITQLPAGSKVLEGTPPGALVAEIPASATCPSGWVCIFQNSNRGGARLAISLRAGVGINLTRFACPVCTNGIHGNDGTWNDQMSSWENASRVLYCWAVNINGGGTRHKMRAGVRLQNVLPSENDQASSIDRLGC